MHNTSENWDPLDIIEQTGIVTYEWTIATDIIQWSSNAVSVLQVESLTDIASGRQYTAVISPDAETSRVEVALELATQDKGDGQYFEIEYPLQPDDGFDAKPVWVEDTGRVFSDGKGMPARVVGTMRVVSARHEQQAAIERMSYFDSLTGILNKDRLTDLLDEDMRRVDREKGSGGFVLIGISHMDMINDMYGFEVGDEIVREAGRRIESVMRINDSLGRYAGTKLGVVLRDCTERELLIAGERFLGALRDEVIMTSAGPVSLTVNIGGVVYPCSLHNTRDVMGAAGEALSEARRSPVPCVSTYEPAPDIEVKRRQNAATALEIIDAMKAQRMRLAYQPIVSASTHRVAFHEALIRMIDSEGKIVEAGSFVGIASQLGLICMVDFCAMTLAVETLIENADAVLSLIVSNETAVDPEWLSCLATSVTENPDIAGRLIVEITESHAAQNLNESIQFVRTIQDLGCRVAIDDFGAGYTSFSNLKHLPVDIIKIDGMYVDDLVNCIENQVFIKSLLDLAKAFSMEVVVEWVSDDATAQLLKQWGVDYLQGSSFGSPIIAPPWQAKEKQPAVREARLKTQGLRNAGPLTNLA